MKKILTLLIFLLTGAHPLTAQNLIRNPQLDSMLWCPADLQQLGDPYPVVGWIEGWTADYFNTCAVGSVNAPNTCFGYAPGDAYAGFLGASYYPDSTHPEFNLEYIKTGVQQRVLPGTQIRIGASFFRGTAFPGLQGPTSSVLFILSPMDTIVTPLLDQSQWVIFDTIITLQDGVDTLKIGPGGSIGPYNGSPYSGYYFVDDIFLEIVSLPIGIENPIVHDHEWVALPKESQLLGTVVRIERCSRCCEVRKVMRKE